MSERKVPDALAILTTAFAGVGSVVFMFMVGRHQRSLLLLGVFTVWVALPFVAMIYAEIRLVSFGWFWMLISLASLAIYSAIALGPPQSQPAKFFLLVPAGAWVLIGVVLVFVRTNRHQ